MPAPMDAVATRIGIEHSPELIIADRQYADINERLISRPRRGSWAFPTLCFRWLMYHAHPHLYCEFGTSLQSLPF
jgi:hypothetical protein